MVNQIMGDVRDQNTKTECDVKNHSLALAAHLGINEKVENELHTIEIVAVIDGVHILKHNTVVYVVAKNSFGIPSDSVIDFNGERWSITNKLIAKLSHIRTPAGLHYGYERYIGKYVEYSGNAYHGMYFYDENRKRIDLLHFNYGYINTRLRIS